MPARISRWQATELPPKDGGRRHINRLLSCRLEWREQPRHMFRASSILDLRSARPAIGALITDADVRIDQRCENAPRCDALVGRWCADRLDRTSPKAGLARIPAQLRSENNGGEGIQ